MELKNTQKMTEAFKDIVDYGNAWKAGTKLREMFLSSLEYLPNSDRRWFQFWKPRKIKNPDYNPEPVEIDIVRGGIQPSKPWPRK